MSWEAKIRRTKAAARVTNERLGAMLAAAEGGGILSYSTWRVIVGLMANGHILPSTSTAPILNRVCAALDAAAATAEAENLERIERLADGPKEA